MRYRQIFDQVSTVEWAIAGAVAAILLSTLAFAVWHFRSARGHEPSKVAKHTKLELSFAAFLVCFATGYYIWTISRNGAERRFLGTPAVTVNVKGFRWCWRFTYVHADVVSTGTCIGSVPRHGGLRARPTRPLLVLPTHEIIRLNLTSSDVIHGFWLPYMDFKMYVYPDHLNSFETELSSTGWHVGRCAVYCGLNHYSMDFDVHLVSPATFRHWLADHSGQVLLASDRHASKGTPS